MNRHVMIFCSTSYIPAAWLVPTAICCHQSKHHTRRHRAPILDYRCRRCGAVKNLFTNTLFSKTRYRCSTIVLMVRGIAQGTPSKHLADELGIDRGHLLSRRHEIQAGLARRLSPPQPLV
jgi:transposase-like protein